MQSYTPALPCKPRSELNLCPNTTQTPSNTRRMSSTPLSISSPSKCPLQNLQSRSHSPRGVFSPRRHTLVHYIITAQPSSSPCLNRLLDRSSPQSEPLIFTHTCISERSLPVRPT
ncbi:hypothetical protein FVEG_15921 [Fusarium verticillioides 7600]|uniref:Uncharacterized protein n=1 Tax=Gibberella moniliformis (strain M3125 / FGSC 7600) TaxID=334819 RepID=W7MN49_GIBM7|nr:hypothetical protein FVEG_15921 [Fusarium verticillioides 7600]XP_018752287.1 hypothetical protein FVEG_15921 [Fusarium verticillioides 7600]XP_018752288.1 hypothetical protein FVEG_15921 [Fusarium verticillioides 7600]XP_018752289.1 hypothetical protein FVEG_15921 [Fusarium verticillioides 7600]XP_018752290.1 hypothetical protein FVEG_15921 [Fusarium verticillioides 7600]XP_018752291.1 hypothetical protein FVEG_15921 [Fusarium verticillioides 7600]XP_018752292.1 hypothetical protein FVEG_